MDQVHQNHGYADIYNHSGTTAAAAAAAASNSSSRQWQQSGGGHDGSSGSSSDPYHGEYYYSQSAGSGVSSTADYYYHTAPQPQAAGAQWFQPATATSAEGFMAPAGDPASAAAAADYSYYPSATGYYSNSTWQAHETPAQYHAWAEYQQGAAAVSDTVAAPAAPAPAPPAEAAELSKSAHRSSRRSSRKRQQRQLSLVQRAFAWAASAMGGSSSSGGSGSGSVTVTLPRTRARLVVLLALAATFAVVWGAATLTQRATQKAAPQAVPATTRQADGRMSESTASFIRKHGAQRSIPSTATQKERPWLQASTAQRKVHGDTTLVDRPPAPSSNANSPSATRKPPTPIATVPNSPSPFLHNRWRSGSGATSHVRAVTSSQLRTGNPKLRAAGRALLALVTQPRGAACSAPHRVGGVPVVGRRKGVVDGAWNLCLDEHMTAQRDAGACLVYSVGIADEWSFDDAMAEWGCQVHAFDPSMNRQDHRRGERVWFHATGLAASNSDAHTGVDMRTKSKQQWRMRTLHSLMQELGHAAPGPEVGELPGVATQVQVQVQVQVQELAVLKFDVEGSEFDVINALTASPDDVAMLRRSVRQIVMEVHFWGPKGPHSHTAERVQGWVRALTRLRDVAGYVLWDSHVNEQSTWEDLKQAEGLTACCFELSFIRAE